MQGVFFRAKTKDHAERLGLKGYVQNLSDGNVEICIAGEDVALLLEALKNEPPPIQIDKIEISKYPSTKTYESFKIKNRA
ncbi:MAG: acylphosphatase [Simkaniaceae bacterium]|nr:MAG: acylphosphatase [Simkaniaceae bacterium]